MTKRAGGASAVDDTDVAGVNFNNYSRDALMRKLARTDEPEPLSMKNDKCYDRKLRRNRFRSM